MPIPVISNYLRWLQKDNPTGTVEVYPEINEKYESSVKGVYIVGDLTGIPLLKMAAESGAKAVRQMAEDPTFRTLRQRAASLPKATVRGAAVAGAGISGGDEPEGALLDVLIIGGGPAGIAAALECGKQGLDYLLLESSHLLQTLENFPKGKPILAKPDDYVARAGLRIEDGTKESLLNDLKTQISEASLRIKVGERVDSITRKGDRFRVRAGVAVYEALRVIVAIGKSGDARKLDIPGEDGEHVFNRLFDPGEFMGRKILVVGGGDSALEASVALARNGNHVTHSYRKKSFARPKEENLRAFEALVKQGAITPLFQSRPKALLPDEAVLESADGGEMRVPADLVFVLIGRELPLAFFKRSGMRMQGDKDPSWYVYLTAMLSFFCMLYFGKAGFAVDLFAGTEGIADTIKAYLAGPFELNSKWGAVRHAWYYSLNFYLGWMGSLVFLLSGAAALYFMVKRRDRYFGGIWPVVKYGYFIAASAFFTGIYFTSVLGRNAGWVEEPTYYYSLLYCTTMALFAFRRAQVRKTRYIRLQMASVVFIQVFFLFLLPFHFFDAFIQPHFAADSYLMREMFPKGKWSSFGFILFWPLNINDFGTSTFWTWFPLVQTFGILFALVYFFGKGAYCGWICSCGGMAESLGDEYRQLSPHGPKAKSLENIGQFVLLFAFIATGLAFAARQGGAPSLFTDSLWGAYKMSIDVFFAGVLGLGVYFFLGGRVWCRFGCPLAALMHIYTRFSPYRIFAEKKKCISCNICTKVCHMGIDVMGYAAKGIPMNDVECVRCSACVSSCPTEVLAFGSLKASDPDNLSRQEVPAYEKSHWQAGIR